MPALWQVIILQQTNGLVQNKSPQEIRQLRRCDGVAEDFDVICIQGDRATSCTNQELGGDNPSHSRPWKSRTVPIKKQQGTAHYKNEHNHKDSAVGISIDCFHQFLVSHLNILRSVYSLHQRKDISTQWRLTSWTPEMLKVHQPADKVARFVELVGVHE